MTTQTRKLGIIERVIQLDDEEALAVLEEALAAFESALPGEQNIPPMPPRSQAEVSARLAEARAQAKTGQTLTSAEVLSRIQRRAA